MLLGSFGSGSITRTQNGVYGEKPHEIHANGETNISTRMVNQDLRGDVFHIRFPAYMGQRTTRKQVVKTCDLRE